MSVMDNAQTKSNRGGLSVHLQSLGLPADLEESGLMIQIPGLLASSSPLLFCCVLMLVLLGHYHMTQRNLSTRTVLQFEGLISVKQKRHIIRITAPVLVSHFCQSLGISYSCCFAFAHFTKEI